jgi:hypothetical protein
MTDDERNLDQAWDDFLQLDATQRATHVPASGNEEMIQGLHAKYRPEAASAEFRERLLQSIPASVAGPGSRAVSRQVLPDFAPARRGIWRGAPGWGYLTMAVIVGMLAIAAGYTYMQTGDEALPTQDDQSLAYGTPGTTDQPSMANVTTVSGQLAMPVNAGDRTVTFSLVKLPPGATYASSSAGTELAFSQGGEVTLQAEKADKQSAISPFVVSNSSASEATFVLVSSGGEVPPNETLDNGTTITSLTDKPIPVESTTDVVIEVIFGTGSGAVPSSAISGTTFLTTEDGAISGSVGGSGFAADATVGASWVGSGEVVVVNSDGITLVEPLTDSPWILFSVSPVSPVDSATPINAAPATVP